MKLLQTNEQQDLMDFMAVMAGNDNLTQDQRNAANNFFESLRPKRVRRKKVVTEEGVN